MYVVSELGIAVSAVISGIILFILFCQVSYESVNPRKEKQCIAMLSLIYFFLWFLVIYVAQTTFELFLTPNLSQIGLFAILLPYILNLSYYFLFRHPPINFLYYFKIIHVKIFHGFFRRLRDLF